MTPKEFWTDVKLIQEDLQFVQFEIVSLWEMLCAEKNPIYQELIREKIKEKAHKEWRFICQLQEMQDNISNPNF